MSMRLVQQPLFKPVVATSAVLLLWLAFHLWQVVQGMSRLPEADRPAPGARGSFEVVLKFPPESFHQTRLQALGRLVKVEGNTVYLREVSRDDAISLARSYWVATMRLSKS